MVNCHKLHVRKLLCRLAGRHMRRKGSGMSMKVRIRWQQTRRQGGLV